MQILQCAVLRCVCVFVYVHHTIVIYCGILSSRCKLRRDEGVASPVYQWDIPIGKFPNIYTRTLLSFMWLRYTRMIFFCLIMHQKHQGQSGFHRLSVRAYGECSRNVIDALMPLAFLCLTGQYSVFTMHCQVHQTHSSETFGGVFRRLISVVADTVRCSTK